MTGMAHSALLSFQAWKRNKNEWKWGEIRKELSTIRSLVSVVKEVFLGKTYLLQRLNMALTPLTQEEKSEYLIKEILDT